MDVTVVFGPSLRPDWLPHEGIASLVLWEDETLELIHPLSPNECPCDPIVVYVHHTGCTISAHRLPARPPFPPERDLALAVAEVRAEQPAP